MLESTARCVNPGSSLVDGQSKVWKGIWKIKTPNRIRHFIWRAARDSLPITQNLRYRHVPVEAFCPTCDEHSESLIHCLWLCDYAKCIWLSDQTFTFPRKQVFGSFGDLVSFILVETSSNTVALFSMIARSI